jgi:hypothetical protein
LSLVCWTTLRRDWTLSCGESSRHRRSSESAKDSPAGPVAGQRQDYHQPRPPSSLQYLSPGEFAFTRAEMQVWGNTSGSPFNFVRPRKAILCIATNGSQNGRQNRHQDRKSRYRYQSKFHRPFFRVSTPPPPRLCSARRRAWRSKISREYFRFTPTLKGHLSRDRSIAYRVGSAQAALEGGRGQFPRRPP